MNLTVLLFLLAAVLQASPLYGQQDDDPIQLRLESLENAIRSLDRQMSLLNDSLKALTPPSVVTDLSPSSPLNLDGHSRGLSTAKIGMIEYSDFECPFCGRHAAGPYRAIHANYVETGKVRYVFRHLPLEPLHPNAKKAAEAVECAGEQGKFWEFHDRLFANQKRLTVTDLRNHAWSGSLTIPEFEKCLNDGKMAAKVEADLTEATNLGFTSTPVFVIGEIQRDGSLAPTRKIVGSHPFPIYEAALNEMLAKVEAK
jgi:protein-disulfide isomerase